MTCVSLANPCQLYCTPISFQYSLWRQSAFSRSLHFSWHFTPHSVQRTPWNWNIIWSNEIYVSNPARRKPVLQSPKAGLRTHSSRLVMLQTKGQNCGVLYSRLGRLRLVGFSYIHAFSEENYIIFIYFFHDIKFECLKENEVYVISLLLI